jgi:hypothetical protein
MPLRDVSVGRSCGIAADVRGYLDAYRPVCGRRPCQREGRWDRNAADCKGEVRLEEEKAASFSAAGPGTVASAAGGTHRGWSLLPSTPKKPDNGARWRRNPGNVGSRINAMLRPGPFLLKRYAPDQTLRSAQPKIMNAARKPMHPADVSFLPDKVDQGIAISGWTSRVDMVHTSESQRPRST